MKPLSASIVVLAAAIIITGGGFMQPSDTQTFIEFVGCVIALVGLAGWMACLKEEMKAIKARLTGGSEKVAEQPAQGVTEGSGVEG